MSDKWTEFLNPDVIRPRFVKTGLFLVAHEMLLYSITERLHQFYSDNWTEDKGWKTSTAYREKVLSLDPKGKNDIKRSSIAWLLQNNAIDLKDERTVHEITDQRNILAHELHKVISGTRQYNFDILFPKITDLITKIDRWWVYNVDIATDPDYSDKEIHADDITPGSSIILNMLTQISLGNDEEAWALYKEFVGNNE